MADQEWCHAQPRGIADPDLAAQIGGDDGGGVGRALAGHFLDQIQHEGADQPDSQHFDLKGRQKLGPHRDRLAVGGTELSRAINRRGAHYIAHAHDQIGVGLMPCGQGRDNMIEQPYRAVGARDRQFACADPAPFLQRDLGAQPGDIGRVGDAIKQCECCIPCGGDDPVTARFGG